MAGSDRPPEQLIRDWLDEHGSVTVGLGALEKTWKVERLGTRERRKVERALRGVGVVVEPSLARASRGERIELSLADRPQTSDVRPQEVGPRPVPLWIAAASVGLMVVGSVGPWAKDVFFTDYGLERSGGLVIAAAGLAALVLLIYQRRAKPSRLPVVAAGLGAVAVGILASDFREVIDDSFVEPAWGLYAAAAGAALLVALSMSLMVRRG